MRQSKQNRAEERTLLPEKLRQPAAYLLNIIRIRLVKNNEKVDKRTYNEQTAREQVQYTASDLALIKLVPADKSEKQTQKESHPLILGLSDNNSAANDVIVIVVIIVVDYDRLICRTALHILDLTAAVCAYYGSRRYTLTAVLAEFRARLKLRLLALHSLSRICAVRRLLFCIHIRFVDIHDVPPLSAFFAITHVIYFITQLIITQYIGFVKQNPINML